MKASVIIAALNAEATIAAAVTSATGQSRRDIEIIVVDDGSTDGTPAVVSRLAQADDRVRLIRHAANRGVSGARNTALKAARGDWLAVLDADDRFAPDRLERMITLAETDTLDIIIDNLDMIDGETSRFIRRAFPDEWFQQQAPLPKSFVLERDVPFQQAFGLGYCKPIFRRRMFLELVGGYDERFSCGEDVLALQTALFAGARFGATPYSGYLYTLSPHSHSHRRGANIHISDVNRLLTRQARSLCPELTPFLKSRQRVIDYTSLVSARQRGEGEEARAFLRRLPPSLIALQALRLGLKRMGVNFEALAPRRVKGVAPPRRAAGGPVR